MSSGMFNSSSGSGGSSGGGLIGGILVQLPPWLGIPLLIIAIIVMVASSISAKKAEEAEAQLDRTEYVGTSRANFEKWQTSRHDAIVPGSLWFEDGSSHRDGYHCKGGQFATEAGPTVTFCCAVEVGKNPLCLVVTP